MSTRIKKRTEYALKDLYELKVKALFSEFKGQHMSFKLLCLYFFFEYVRPQTLYPAIDILPYAQLCMLGALVSMLSDKSVSWVSSKMSFLLILFCAIIFISGLMAYKPLVAWSYRNIFLGWVIVYFLIINIVNTEKRLFLFIVAYLLYSLKMGQHGTIDWISRGFAFAGYGLIGAPGWFRNSGEFAIQMLIFGSLAIAFVVSLKSYWGKYKKLIMFSCAATGFIAVMGASSRGAQLGLLVLVIWTVPRQKNGLKGLITVGLLGFLLYSYLPAEQMERFEESGEDETSVQRLVYWEIAYKVTNDYPAFGVGYFNWVPYVSHLYPNGVGPLEKVELPHNIFFQASADLGYTGLVMFLMMIITAFILNMRTRKMSKNYETRLIYNLSLGLDAGMIGYLAAGSFVSVFYYPFFWVQISIIVALNQICNKKSGLVKVSKYK